MINDAPQWLANLLIVVGIVLAMWAIIATLVAVWRWALLGEPIFGEKPSEYDRWSGE